MAETGILLPDERVELIRGEILKMSPIGTRHGAAVDRVNRALGRLAGDNAIVRVQGCVVLDDLCAPQPDIVLLKPRDDFYVRANTCSADIILLIEVADSSLEYDTTVKKDLYAILGVHEYWVADLVNHRLLVFHDPHNDSYTAAREFHAGDRIAPQLLQDCQIDVNVLLP